MPINCTPPKNNMATINEAYPETEIPKNIFSKIIFKPKRKDINETKPPKYDQTFSGIVEKEVIP